LKKKKNRRRQTFKRCANVYVEINKFKGLKFLLLLCLNKTRQSNPNLGHNVSTIATISNRPEPPRSQEDELLKFIAKLQEQSGHKQPTGHNFGEGGRTLSQPSHIQNSPTAHYGSRKLEADNTLPTVNIKISMLNSQIVPLVCNLNHTIADIYQHVNYLMSQPQPYVLKTSHPPIELADGTLTVEKAQLRNALIRQVKA